MADDDTGSNDEQGREDVKDDRASGSNEEGDSDDGDSGDDDDSEISDSMKNQLLYKPEAMKGFIRMHRVDRREKGPLLDISDCTQTLDAERLQMFGQALREDQDLQAVELCLDGLDNDLAKNIAVFFGKSTKLSSVDLSSNTSSAQGVDIKLVRLFLHTFLRNPRANDLALWQICTLPPTTPLPDITKIIGSCRSLETAKCCACSINVSTALLQGLILEKAAKHVEFTVDWPSDPETCRLLQLLVNNVKTLQTLRLDSLSLQALESMVEGLSSLPDLQCLELVVQPPPATGGTQDHATKTNAAQLVVSMLHRTRSIRRLDLQGIDWTGESATLLGSVLRSSSATVKELSLAGGPLSFHDMLHGTQLLCEVDLSRCNLSNVTLGELQNTLVSHRGLQTIRFPALDDYQMQGLLSGIAENKSIRSLDVILTELGEATAWKLRETLGVNSTLRHLALSGDDVVVIPNLMHAFSSLLEKDGCNLSSLALSGIRIGAGDADRLFGALQSNTKLRRLSLDKSGLDEAGTVRVCRHLPLLRHLNDLKLDIPEDFEEDHEEEFVQGMEGNTVLTKFSFAADTPRLESIAEYFIQRNRTKWMFEEDSRKTLWPLFLCYCDDSAVFHWALALSDQLVSSSNKRKRDKGEEP